jgi:hypothetical protein
MSATSFFRSCAGALAAAAVTLLSAGCGATLVPRNQDGAAARLLTHGQRTVSGIDFIECTYGSAGLFGSRTKFAFWSTRTPEHIRLASRVEPGSGATFVPIAMQACPPDSALIPPMIDDAQAPTAAGPARLPKADGAGIVDPDRLWTQWLQMKQTASARPASASSRLNTIMDSHGRGIAALIDQTQPLADNRSQIANGQSPYPTQRMTQLVSGTLRTLEEMHTYARRSYIMSNPPAGLAYAMGPYNEAIAALKARQSALKWVADEQGRREQMRVAQEREVRRNADQCATASAAASGEGPTEVDMCRAMVADLRRMEDGFKPVQQILQTFLGPLGEAQGLESDLLSFKKKECRPEPARSAYFICRYDSNVQWKKGSVFDMLERSGLPPLYSEASFYRADGGWRMTLTPAQQEAELRHQEQRAAEAARQKDREKRARQVRCMQQLAGTNYGGLCLMN